MKQLRITSIVLIAFFLSISFARAQTTAFTYQGRLNDNGALFSGTAEFQPTLWSAVSAGSQIAANTPAQVIVSVTNGLFTLPLNFGANFPGADRWLQLEVRTAIGAFTLLSPRQQLTPTPYAITASNLSGTLPAGQLSGPIGSANLGGTYSSALTLNNAGNSFSGSGAGLTSLNASQLTTGTVPDARLAANVARTNQVWSLNGNSGTSPGTQFLGTTDNQPVEIKVNGLRTMRLEWGTNSPNIIGGFGGNFVAPGFFGSTIGGGGATNNPNAILGHYGTIAGGLKHEIGTNSLYGTVGGGLQNRIGAFSISSTIAGGERNTLGTNASFSTIGGGRLNNVGTNSPGSTVGGGLDNNVDNTSEYATISGGYLNNIGTNSSFSAIGGGKENTIAAKSDSAVIAGGNLNDIGTNADFGAIGGGYDNNIAANSIYATIGGGNWNDIGTDAEGSTIGGGHNNNVGLNSFYAVISGGYQNNIRQNSVTSAIGGGENNEIVDNANAAAIAGGKNNSVGFNSSYSTIGGGEFNNILDNSAYATIPGGKGNTATNQAFAAGSSAKATNRGAFVWSDGTGTITSSTTNNSVTMRASGGYRFFTGTSAAGAQLLAGATAWSVLSDRNMKKDIQPVNSKLILEKLSKIPVAQWHYTWETESSPKNLGPMAQDFKAAFFPGREDTSISTLEFDGVALAAIQGLNQKLEEKETELAALKRRLEKLEQRIQSTDK